MGVMFDIFKKGNYVETPYNNLFEIKARDIDKNITKLAKFKQNVVLIVNISPYDKNFNSEFEKLISLKEKFNQDDFQILALPSSQIDNVEMSDKEMKEILLKNDLVKNNLDKINLFNRVYVNGEETCEVLKYCYRNSPLFMFREGKAKVLENNFSKFLINKNGIVNTYYTRDINNEEIEENIQYLIKQKVEKIKIRDEFINFNKFH